MKPVLVIHGGAGSKPRSPKSMKKIRSKIRAILSRAYEKLVRGDALEAVTFAVKLLEDDSAFNAGTGSMLQSDGKARLSASIMDGSTGRFAAVINIEKIKNPILVARALLDQRDRVLAGPGATRFAQSLGMKPRDTRTQSAIRRWKKRRREQSSDTVGAIALDREGSLAAATSTGGRGFEMPHRVSDSAMPIANFADRFSAVSATGIGEDIIDEGLAVKIATRASDGKSLAGALQKTFRELRKNGRRIGAVGLDRRGNVFAETTTPILIHGLKKGSRIKLFC